MTKFPNEQIVGKLGILTGRHEIMKYMKGRQGNFDGMME
jgi:hypothetical protein